MHLTVTWAESTFARYHNKSIVCQSAGHLGARLAQLARTTPQRRLRLLSQPAGEGDDLDAWVASLAAQQPAHSSRRVQRQASAKGGGLSATQAAALEQQVLSAVLNTVGSTAATVLASLIAWLSRQSTALGGSSRCGWPRVEE